jgi:hypothetical protein
VVDVDGGGCGASTGLYAGPSDADRRRHYARPVASEVSSTSGHDEPSLSVVVCRGCCCGTTAKHPGVEHDAQVEALRAALPSDRRARLFVVDCLGPCEHSNVVVVRAGERRHWFGHVLRRGDTAVLARWLQAGAPLLPPPMGRAYEFAPDAAGTTLAMDPRRGSQLVDLVHAMAAASAAEDGGAWVLGVEGATAEVVPGPRATVERCGGEIVVRAEDAGLRLIVDDDVRAFLPPGRPDPPLVVLAVPAARAVTSSPVVRLLGEDVDAIAGGDRPEQLVELGLGLAGVSFCVRVDDDLLGLLRLVEGRPLEKALAEVGSLLVERSPTRVVRTPLGRAEIATPIPTADGASPDGSHTHLLPALLELGRALPAGIALPPTFVPGAVFYPPRNWALPR